MKILYKYILLLFLFVGCGPVAYKPQPITYSTSFSSVNNNKISKSNPFLDADNKTINKLSSQNNNDGIQISAEIYHSQIQNLNYSACGLTAVYIEIKNSSKQVIRIDKSQFSASINNNEFFPYPYSDVPLLVINSAGSQEASRGLVEGAAGGAAGGAVIGGLISMALGGNFSSGAGAGAVGGAIGGAAGGAVGYKTALNNAVVAELRSKQFVSKIIYPNMSTFGVIFFPKGVNYLNLHLINKTISIIIRR